MTLKFGRLTFEVLPKLYCTEKQYRRPTSAVEHIAVAYNQCRQGAVMIGYPPTLSRTVTVAFTSRVEAPDTSMLWQMPAAHYKSATAGNAQSSAVVRREYRPEDDVIQQI